ncbi:MAG: hypothetical protein AB7N76_30775 [Planctomycetota bacterium]
MRPRDLRLRAATWRRLRSGLRTRERAWRQGVLDEDRLAAAGQSVVAHLERGETAAVRRAFVARSPPAVW